MGSATFRKSWRFTLCVSLGATGVGAVAMAPECRGADSTTVAFVDVTVIPMDRDRTIPGQTVIVRDGRITAIGPAARTAVPNDALKVDGRGKFLMPGLAEMHAHIPGGQASDEVTERVLFLYLANGITTVRGMLGHPKHLALRERAAKGELLSPTIYTSGPSLNGSSVPTVEAAVKAVTEQKAAGYDFLKIHPGITREVFDSLAAAAHRAGIRFAGHVPEEVGVERALAAKYASIDHLDGYVEYLLAYGTPLSGAQPQFFGVNVAQYVDENKIPGIAAATRAADVWNVPTQVLIENLASDEPAEQLAQRPETRYWPPQNISQWVEFKKNFRSQTGSTAESLRRVIEVRRKLIKALHSAGAGLLLGSDAPQIWNVPGFSTHRELETLVAAGLTPYQALETGTRSVAVYFNTLRETGTVEVGKRADLILLNANPLVDVTNTTRRAGVMIRGRWLPESELRRRLEEVAEKVKG